MDRFRWVGFVWMMATVLIFSVLYGDALAASPREIGPESTVTVNYLALPGEIANPERGLVYFNTECDQLSFDLNTLKSLRTNQNISLALCNFYLSAYKGSPIGGSALDMLQNQLKTVRDGGLKVILRFAYTQSENDDASLARILAHIDQLAPVIQANSDVILLWQAGFIGPWGEWHSSKYFGQYPNITAQQWADRKTLVNKMLSVLPATRMVSLRTPYFSYKLYGNSTVTAGTAFRGSSIARLGQFNDAFVGSETDLGTYINKAIDYPWLQAQTTYTAMGGETAWGAPVSRSDCPTALQEMKKFHWSYINMAESQIMTKWINDGCLPAIKKNLGYRFELLKGLYPDIVKAGGPFRVQLSLRNVGYAAPFNPRAREIILRNTSTGVYHRLALSSDPRFWLAGATTNIDQTWTLPSTLPPGSYALYLSLPDPVMALKPRPEYAIRMANQNTWDASKGWNNLRMTIQVLPP